MPVIGKGAFTNCYDNGKTVYLVSTCQAKDCYATLASKGKKYFPDVDSVTVDGCNVYVMEKFQINRAIKPHLDADQYNDYLTLRSIFRKSCCDSSDRYFVLHDLFSEIENETLRYEMLETLDDFSNYTQNIGFEISPRNVATKNGKLILLDVFYSIDLLKKKQKQKQK